MADSTRPLALVLVNLGETDSLKPLRELEGAVQAAEAALEISERVAQRIAGFPAEPLPRTATA